jgi:hypothetical protein
MSPSIPDANTERTRTKRLPYPANTVPRSNDT